MHSLKHNCEDLWCHKSGQGVLAWEKLHTTTTPSPLSATEQRAGQGPAGSGALSNSTEISKGIFLDFESGTFDQKFLKDIKLRRWDKPIVIDIEAETGKIIAIV